MSMRLTLSAFSGLALLSLPACSQGADSATAPAAASVVTSASAPVVASALTSADNAAVKALIRDILINNPDILEDAMAALDEKKKLDLSQKLASDTRDFSIGPDDAAVTVVEFFDYRCGYCKLSMEWVLDVTERYPDDVRVVFKEFPILSAQSREAAYAALAAGRQGKYFEMHQALMNAPGRELEDADIDAIAKEAGVNVKQMRKDMLSAEIRQQIVDVRSLAIEIDTNSTPTFFVNGEQVAGADEVTLNRLIAEAVG